MLANIAAPSSAPAPARGAADSRAAVSGEEGVFADALNGAMQAPAPANAMAAQTAPQAAQPPNAPHDPNQLLAAQPEGGADAAALVDQPAVLAALQEVPSAIAPTSDIPVGTPNGEETPEIVDPEQEQLRAEIVVFPQVVEAPLAPQLPPPAQALGAAVQQATPGQASETEAAGAGPKAQPGSSSEASTSQDVPGPKAAPSVAKAAADAQMALPTDAVAEPVSEAADTRPVAAAAGGAPQGEAAFPASPGAPPVAAAPSTPPADLRGYTSVVTPPPPARQISPAILSLTAQSGTANAPSRLVVALRPDDLGRVEIAVEQAPDGPAEIRFSADRPETLRMLMRDTDAIQALLQQAGVGTDNGRNLSFSLSDGGSNGQPSRERESRPQHQQRHLGQRDDAPAQSLAARVERSLPLGRIDIAL